MLAAIARTTLDLLYPRQCRVCGDVGHCGTFSFFCDFCLGSVTRVEDPCCVVCGLPFHGKADAEFACPNCREMTLHFDRARALLRFQGVVRHVVHGLKYSHDEHWARVMISWMRDGVDSVVSRAEVDVILPVPLHPVRERHRGFNQAWFLARELASWWNVPAPRRALARVRDTETQTHFNREERMVNLRGAFVLRQAGAVSGKRVLLVDDVLTTGSTTSECARVLREAGATSVLVFTLARG